MPNIYQRESSQAWLRKPMQALGYKATKKIDGLCCGLALLAVIKMLANEFEGFYKQINELQTTDKYPDAIELEETIFANYKQIQSLQKQISLKDDDELLTEINHLKNKITQDVNQFALMENIFILQDIDQKEFVSLFPSNEQPKTQDLVPTTPFILPETLLEQGGVVKVDAFSGTYSENDLKKLLKPFKDILHIEPLPEFIVPLALLGASHAITIGYDVKEKKWLLVDANQNITKVETESEVAAFIMQAFSSSSKGKVLFTTITVATKQHQELMSNKIMMWKNTKKWQSLHQLKFENISYCDKDGAHLALLYVRNNDTELLSALFKKRIPIRNNPFSRNQESSEEHYKARLLINAIFYGNIEVINTLLELGADSNILFGGTSALHSAITYNATPEVIATLMRKGANALTKDKHGETALGLALRKKRQAILPHLLNIHTPHDIIQTHLSTENLHRSSIFKNQNEFKPSKLNESLFYAANSGHYKTLEKTLQTQKENINVIHATKKITPLHAAVMNKHVKIAAALIEAGADINLSHHVSKLLPLHSAAMSKDAKLIDLLCKHGAAEKINQVTLLNHSPLDLAIEVDNIEGVVALIKYGAIIKPQMLSASKSTQIYDILNRALNQLELDSLNTPRKDN